MTMIRYRRYPYPEWGKKLAALIGPLNEPTVIDAPSGDGAVSYWLIRNGINRRYELYDLADGKIAHARELATWAKTQNVEMTAAARDLRELNGTGDAIWLLANSFFLLPDIGAIVDRMRPRAKHIVGVFPVTSHPGYRAYVKHNPGVNVNEMNEPAVARFFAKHGYRLVSRDEMTFMSLRHIRPDPLRKAVSLVAGPLERLFPRRNGAYWYGLFTRDA